MATTVSTTDYNGNGSTTAYSFTFPYLKTEDVKVALNGKTLATTEYTFATATSIQLSSISGSLNAFQTNTQNSSGAPLNGVKVLIYRDTDVAAAKAVFASGSSFRATDLNNNKEQSLYTEQELKDIANPNNEPNTINGTGNPGQGLGFEGNLYFDTTNNLLFGPKENGAWGTGTPISATSTESIQDIVGAMFSGNTETNITATYQDSDGTIDLVSTDTNTQLTTEEVQDIVGGMFSGNTETNITATYQDSDGTIDLVASNTNTQLSNEQVQDIAGAMFSSNTENGVTVTYQDGDGTIDLEVTSLYSSGNKKVEATNTGATVTGKLTVTGDLQIDGTTTTVNSTTMKVDDKNIVLGAGAINDAAADGGGITLESGDSNKTFNWVDSTDAWTSSEHIHLGDSKKLLVGTGSDLQIFHDASDSYIKDTGTGSLYITGSEVKITNAAVDENIAKFIPNGAVEIYYDNTKKFESTAGGVRSFGDVTLEGELNFMGNSDSTRYIDARLGDGNALIIRGTSNGDANHEKLAEFFRGGSTKFYYDGGGTPTLEVTSTGARVYGQLTVEDQLNFMGGSDSTRYIDARVGDGNALTIRGATGGDGSHETLAEFFRGGSSGVKLYHNNSSKLETTSAGATVTGTLTATTFSGSGANLTNLPGGSFTQTGTGAVSRTVDAKLKDTINVWDFIPSGTTTASTDCASYFQAAINTGKVVYVPKGSYRIDSTLVLDGGYESLIGDASMPILLKWTEGPAIQISEPGGTGLNEYCRVENFYIQRKISGSFTCPNYNATLTESLAGVVVSGHGAGVAAAVQKPRLSNLRVGNFAVGFFFADCVGVTVHKCFTQNLGNYTSATSTADGTTITSSMWGVGFYFNATRYASGSISPLASIEIVECDDVRQNDPTTIKSVSYLVVGEDIRDIFFTNSESSHADYGYYISGLTNDDLNWDVHIIRPIIDTFKKHAIYINNVDGVGAVSVIGGYYVGVEGAEASIYASNSNGISISGGAQILGLTNHDGTNNTDDGIRLDSCTSCSIIGNRFGNLQYAISLNGTTFSTIQGNVISAAATAEDAQDPALAEAIRLFGNSTFNTVGNNTIRGLSASVKYTKGIVLASGSDNCKLVGNIIDSTTVTTGVDDSASGTEYNRLSTEAIQDIVGAMFSGNTETNITATYQDGDGTIDLVSTDTNTQLSTEEVQDIVGAMFSGNTETNITATYQDGDGTIDLVASSSAGGSTGTDYNDNVKVRLGTGNDLELYHDGTNSYIKNNTNDFYIQNATSDWIYIQPKAGEHSFIAKADGGIDLYFDNSKKFEVTSTGSRVYGQLTVEDQLNFMGGSDTTRYIDARVGDGGALTLRGATGGDGSHETLAEFYRGNGHGVKLYFDNTKKFETYSSGCLLGDSVKLALGNSEDLQLYHDSSDSYLSQTGSGNLIIQGNGTNNIAIRGKSGEEGINVIPDGAVELYHNNLKKFETTSIGCKLNDSDTTSALQFTNSAGTGSYIVQENRNVFGLKDYDAHYFVKCTKDGSTELYYDNSKKFHTVSDGALCTGHLQVTGGNNFYLNDNGEVRCGDSGDLQLYHDGTNNNIYSKVELHIKDNDGGYWIRNEVNGHVNLYYDGSLKFHTTSTGARVYGQLTVEDELNFMGGSDSARYIDARLGDGNALSIRGTSGGDANHQNLAKFYRGGACEFYHDATIAFKTLSGGGLDLYGNISGGDNRQIRLGNDADLQIYHDGSNSWVKDTGTGGLILSGSVFEVYNQAVTEKIISSAQDGAVELYYNGVKHFETNAGGCKVNDNKYFACGNNSDLQIYHNGSHSFFYNGTGNVYHRTPGNLYLQVNGGSNETALKAASNSSVELYYDNSKKFETTSGGAKVTGHFNISEELNMIGGPTNKYFDVAHESHSFFFRRINASDGNHSTTCTVASNNVWSADFNDTSDEKLKKNIVSIPDGAIANIKQLRPVNFDWKDETAQQGNTGFVAQEVKAILPNLVNGEEYDGTEGKAYSLNTGGVLAHVTKALQEAIAKIETLEAKVAALESS